MPWSMPASLAMRVNGLPSVVMAAFKKSEGAFRRIWCDSETTHQEPTVAPDTRECTVRVKTGQCPLHPQFEAQRLGNGGGCREA